MKILIKIALFLLPLSMFAQKARVDVILYTSGPAVPVSGGPLPQALLLANSSVSLCAHPSPSPSVCSPITTYTDSTGATSCPVDSPMVPLPGSACSDNSGPKGNLGFWYDGGIVDYYVYSSYGTFGPYSVSSGTGGGGGGTVSPGANYSLPAYPLSSSTTVSPSNIKTDATGNNITIPGNLTMHGTGCGAGTVPLADGTGCTNTAGGGNTVSTSLSNNVLPKANGANSIINSSVTDNGTTVSTTETFTAPTVTACNANGVLTLNPGCFSGADMGAQINSAVSACPSSGCTIVAPQTGAQASGQNIVISKANVTINFAPGLVLTMGSGFNIQLLANDITLQGYTWASSTIQCGTGVSCVKVGSLSSSGVYFSKIYYLAFQPTASTFPTAAITYENARNAELKNNYITGFTGTNVQNGSIYNSAGVLVLENCYTYQTSDNQITGNNYGVAVMGDSWNAWKMAGNLINSNQIGVYLALQNQNGISTQVFGLGQSGGFNFDRSNHCENNNLTCFDFVNGEFYEGAIYGQYDENLINNTQFVTAKGDGIQNHQLEINGLDINGGGGYFNNSNVNQVINSLDSTGGYNYGVSPVTISSASGAGSVLTVNTSSAHGITCTPFCPFVNIQLTGTTPFLAARFRISGVTSSTQFTIPITSAATYNCASACGTVGYAQDVLDVTINGQAWRAAFKPPLFINAVGTGTQVRAAGNYLFDGFGNLYFDTDPTVTKASLGATVYNYLGVTPTVPPVAPSLQITNAIEGTNEVTGVSTVDTSLVANQATFGTPPHNLLTLNQATFASSTTGWFNNGNATLALSGSPQGASMTAITANIMSIAMGPTTGSYVAATPGTSYTGLASLQAATTGRDVSIDLQAYDSGGTSLGRFATSSFTSNDVVGSWTQITATGVAPASTAFVGLIVRVGFNSIPVLGEVHYSNFNSISTSPSTFWFPPAITHATVDIAGNGDFHTLTGDNLTSGNCMQASTAGLITTTGSPCNNGVSSINSVNGAFTFTGAGVSCTSTTCTFTGSGSGIGSITWAIPSWLTASPTTISASGTQTFSATTGQTSHQVIGTCGSATTFGPCALVAADIPTLNQNTTGTAAGLTNCVTASAGSICYWNGSQWTVLAGNASGTQFLQETSAGVPSWTIPSASSVALSAITAATGANTIASGNNSGQVWNWALTTASTTAFTFGETTAATGSGDQLLQVKTLAGSTAPPLTVSDSLTGSQSLAALQVFPTWNTTGVVDAGILENVTNTASGTGSLLMDLQVAGTSEFKVDKVGNATAGGSLTSAAPSGDAGMVAIVGNTANQTCPTNDFCLGGFSSAGATAYGLQPSNTAPATNQIMYYPTPTSGWSQGVWISLAGSGADLTTGPSSSTTNDIASFTGTAGQLQDSGVLATNVVTASGTLTNNAFITGAGTKTVQAVALTGPVMGNGASAPTAATGHQLEAPLVCADSSASGTAQTCTTSPSFTPAANDCVIYTTTTANSGTGLTLNVNALGAKSVAKWLGATTLVAGDVAANNPQLACYNGTVWNLSTIGNAPAGGGVSSFTGDATVLSNSGSTGAVTATLANAAVGTVLGNATSSAAAPTYHTLTAVNGQTATYTATATDFAAYKTITVASGTFTITLVINTSQPAAGQYIDIINYGSGTVTVARNGQNLNGGTASLTLPAATATNPTSTRVISDGANYFASQITAGSAAGVTSFSGTGIISNSSSSGAVTATWSGTSGGIPYFSGATTTASSAALAANSVVFGGGAGTTPATGDLWLAKSYVPANCNNATAGAGFSLPTSAAPTPFCRTGTNVQTGYLQFTASQCAQFQDEIPSDWDTASGPYVRVNYTQNGTTASQSIIFTIQSISSSTSDDTAFNTAQTFSTTTTGATANTPYTQNLQLNSTSITGWAVTQMANFKVCTSASSNATTNLQMVEITWPHKTPGTAGAQ